MTHETSSIGVGPHPEPWPTGRQYDKELLRTGDRRNVADRYRYWTVEAIKADMATDAAPLEIAIENWQHDFNIGTIVRTANAFNVAKIHIIGRRHWNRRGAMVTDRYVQLVHHPDVATFVAAVRPRQIIAVDNLPGSVSLQGAMLPEDAVLVFGGEGPGLSPELVAASDQMVQIEQFGSTRSVNVGVAAGIVMYAWLQRWRLTA